MPEITLLLHQCMLPTQQYDDDLVILLRSCIPFFQNPRRVKHDHAWQEDNNNSLTILLKWCMPTILSLYPHIFVKDVNFKARIQLLRLFRILLVGSFEMRNYFYVQNKIFIKMCLMEYCVLPHPVREPPPQNHLHQDAEYQHDGHQYPQHRTAVPRRAEHGVCAPGGALCPRGLSREHARRHENSQRSAAQVPHYV